MTGLILDSHSNPGRWRDRRMVGQNDRSYQGRITLISTSHTAGLHDANSGWSVWRLRITYRVSQKKGVKWPQIKKLKKIDPP